VLNAQETFLGYPVSKNHHATSQKSIDNKFIYVTFYNIHHMQLREPY
jgi:hypothetical protein